MLLTVRSLQMSPFILIIYVFIISFNGALVNYYYTILEIDNQWKKQIQHVNINKYFMYLWHNLIFNHLYLTIQILNALNLTLNYYSILLK